MTPWRFVSEFDFLVLNSMEELTYMILMNIILVQN